MSVPPQIAYEQQYNLLAAEHRKNGDPTVFVFDTYLRWKGVPLNGARPTEIPEHLSRHFSVLEYAGTADFRVFATLGASLIAIPGSAASFNDTRGVRYEYLLHAPERHSEAISELLMLVAEFPYKHNVEVQPGYVLNIGTPIIPGSHMEYLYFTYPYLDDAKLYEGHPWGQIEQGKALIHVLWALPMYLSEYQYLRQHGVDQFEELINHKHQQRYDAFDFERLPYI
jgi:hypothetical protein